MEEKNKAYSVEGSGRKKTFHKLQVKGREVLLLAQFTYVVVM